MMEVRCSKPSSSAGDTFLERGLFCESALHKLNGVAARLNIYTVTCTE
jgi:hypothetical protein